MSDPRSFAAKFVAVLLAVQLYAAPVIAEGIISSSGGFDIVGSKPLSIHHRSKHHVNRYYFAPKVKAHSAKPPIHHVKPRKKHHRATRKHHKKRYKQFYVPKRYGIRHRKHRHGGLWHSR